MREGLKKCVKTAIDANDIGVNELPGEMGRTINFLIQTWPAQAIQFDTSSFRLDRLAAYLSHDGPKLYFQGARKICRDEMRWFADQLLDEILPRYAPAAGAFKSFSRYLENVFSQASTAVGLTSYLYSCFNSSAPFASPWLAASRSSPAMLAARALV